MHTRTFRDAFTLIEIIVVVSIISILTASGMAAYNRFSDEQKLTTETKKIVDEIDLLRKKALAGEKSAIQGECEGDLLFQSLALDGTQVSDYRNCSDTGEVLTKRYNLAGDGMVSVVSVNVVRASGTVETISRLRFAPPYATMSAVTSLGTDTVFAPLDSLKITIKSNNINKCIQITVNPSGVISEGNKYDC